MESLIIGIAGGSGSGKSTFTNRIKQYFGDDVVVLYHDNYYRKQDGIPFRAEGDCELRPSGFSGDRASGRASEAVLKQGKSIECPVYDYTQHNRSDRAPEHRIQSPVILVEGILLLADPRVREPAGY